MRNNYVLTKLTAHFFQKYFSQLAWWHACFRWQACLPACACMLASICMLTSILASQACWSSVNTVLQLFSNQMWTNLFDQVFLVHELRGDVSDSFQRFVQHRTFRHLIGAAENGLEKDKCYPEHDLDTWEKKVFKFSNLLRVVHIIVCSINWKNIDLMNK